MNALINLASVPPSLPIKHGSAVLIAKEINSSALNKSIICRIPLLRCQSEGGKWAEISCLKPFRAIRILNYNKIYANIQYKELRLVLKNNLRIFYNFLIYIGARPSLQVFFEKLFRVLIGFMGYMNWSSDFKLTGEKKLISLLKTNNIRCVLDIGANSGQWAHMVLNELETKVISFEPQLEVYKKLVLLKENYKEFYSYNLALGNYSGKTLINVHDNSSELSFINPLLHKMPLLEGHTDHIEDINITTLDNIYLQNPVSLNEVDFVKIDTEGHELDVLLGGKNFLDAVKPKFIQVEINWHHIFTETTLYKLSCVLENYRVFKILPSGSVLYELDPKLPVNNLFQLSNFLFVKKGIVFNT